MVKNSFRVFARYYEQVYLKRKDYKSESKSIKNLIKQFERKQSKTLLDVGCGTGEHLKYLSRNYKCKGIDISKEMIDIAKTKVKDVDFEIANMMDFKLKEKFDVITCLFSSIGYVETFENLVKTLKNFWNHLSNPGLIIVEPWIFKKDFRKGTIAIDTYEDEKAKLVRMATSKLTKSKWLVYMQYLIGTDGKIEHEKETHKMLAADYEDYVKAFDLAGYDNIKFLVENLWERCRGLFIAIG